MPKPGDQDQKGDQEECLKIPPVMTALEDATLLCSSKSPLLPKLCIATIIGDSCTVFPILVSRKPQRLCRGFGDIAIGSGRGRGAEKALQGSHLRGCCVQAAPCGFHPHWHQWLSGAGIASWHAQPAAGSREPYNTPVPALPPRARPHTYLPPAPRQARGVEVPTPWRRICPAGISTAPSLPSLPHCRLRVPHLCLLQQV